MSIIQKLDLGNRPNAFVLSQDLSTWFIKVDNSYILEEQNKPQANLTSSTLPNDDNVYVSNIMGLQNNTSSYFLFGDLGTDNAELLQGRIVIQNSGGIVINLTSPLKYAHSKGQSISPVDWNQIELESCDTSDFLPVNIYSLTFNIDPSNWYSILELPKVYIRSRVFVTAKYYRMYFFGSVQPRTVYSLITELDKDWDIVNLFEETRRTTGNTYNVRDSFLLSALAEARDIAKNQFRYGQGLEWRQRFDYRVPIKAGTNYIDAPTDIDFTDTANSIFNVELVYAYNTKYPVYYHDKRFFNSDTYNLLYCFVRKQVNATTLVSKDNYNIGTTVLAFTDVNNLSVGQSISIGGNSGLIVSNISGNNVTLANPLISPIKIGDNITFADNSIIVNDGALNLITSSGSLLVSAEAPTDQVFLINYTGINYTKNSDGYYTLTGVTGITRIIPNGSQLTVSNQQTFPNIYTVYKDDADSLKIWFNRIFPPTIHYRACKIDYYRDLDPITSVNQNLPEPYKQAYKHYLRYAIKRRRDDELEQNDPDYQKFLSALNQVITNDVSQQSVIIS